MEAESIALGFSSGQIVDIAGEGDFGIFMPKPPRGIVACEQ